MNHHQSTDRAQAERRAEYRSLVSDPDYNPRSFWRCPTCDGASPSSSTRCETCDGQGPGYAPQPLERPRTPVIVRVGRGQALVEMALVLPIMLFVCLGFGDVGFLFSFRDHQARSTATVADYAAQRPGDSSWQSVASNELPGCEVTVEEAQQGVVQATATCQWTPVLLGAFWGASVPVTTSESSALDPEPTAEPSPTPCLPVCLP